MWISCRGAFLVANLLVLATFSSASLIRTRHDVTMQEKHQNQSICGDALGERCQQKDIGSCGNACCVVDFHFEEKTTNVYEKLKTFLTSGGDSDSFAYLKPLGETTEIYSNNSDPEYILAGTHKIYTHSSEDTLTYHFDRLTFNIRRVSDKKSVARVFSMSAKDHISDQGQNYKTLEFMFVDSLYVQESAISIVYGCGGKKKNSKELELAMEPPPSPRKKNKVGANAVAGSKCEKDVFVEDCFKVDKGSCGDACCVMDVHLRKSPEVVYNGVKAFLKVGGDSKSYKYVPWKREDGSTRDPDDIRNLDDELDHAKFRFLWKADHIGIHNYTNELYLSVRARQNDGDNDNDMSILRAFSMMPGTVDDEGQNYKTLMYMLKDLHIEKQDIEVIHGCGQTAQSGSSTAKLTAVVVSVVIAVTALRFW